MLEAVLYAAAGAVVVLLAIFAASWYGVLPLVRWQAAPASERSTHPAAPDEWRRTLAEMNARVDAAESAVRVFRSELEDHYGKMRAAEERMRKRRAAAAAANSDEWDDEIEAPGAPPPDPRLDRAPIQVRPLQEEGLSPAAKMFLSRHPNLGR